VFLQLRFSGPAATLMAVADLCSLPSHRLSDKSHSPTDLATPPCGRRSARRVRTRQIGGMGCASPMIVGRRWRGSRWLTQVDEPGDCVEAAEIAARTSARRATQKIPRHSVSGGLSMFLARSHPDSSHRERVWAHGY
jgi:hypothetical protein